MGGMKGRVGFYDVLGYFFNIYFFLAPLWKDFNKTERSKWMLWFHEVRGSNFVFFIFFLFFRGSFDLRGWGWFLFVFAGTMKKTKKGFWLSFLNEKWRKCRQAFKRMKEQQLFFRRSLNQVVRNFLFFCVKFKICVSIWF